jgi:ribosomal protein S18 acetylase RimI-like enzyme
MAACLDVTYSCRQATPEDARVIALMQIRMADETENLKLDPAVVEKGVQLPFQHPNLATYYVVVATQSSSGTAQIEPQFINDSGEEIAGMLMTTHEYFIDAAATLWWIQSVYTSPTHRKRGVFSKLYKYVEDRSNASPDVMGLRLYVETENAGAQQTYKKMGMSIEPFIMLKNMKGDF